LVPVACQALVVQWVRKRNELGFEVASADLAVSW